MMSSMRYNIIRNIDSPIYLMIYEQILINKYVIETDNN